MKKNIILSLIIIFSACSNNSSNIDSISKQKVTQESKKLNDYFEKEFNELVNRKPQLQTSLGIKKDYDKWNDISPKEYQYDLNQTKKSLLWLKDSVDINLLDKSSLLSYQLYVKELEDQIEDQKYRLFGSAPYYEYPVNQMFGMQSEIPSFLINMHSVSSEKEAIDYIARLNGVKPLFNQLEINIKEKESAGIVAQKFVYEHVLNDSRNIISGYPFSMSSVDTSALFKDIFMKVNSLDIGQEIKDNLINDAKQALNESVKPAYESLISLISELSNNYDQEDGVWRWENGEVFYDYILKRTTTTNLSADEIHQIGLREVDRIHNEMIKIMDLVGFSGTLKDFFNELKESDDFYYPQTLEGEKAYMAEAKNIIDQMELRLDELFITKPKAQMIVKAVEDFREKSAGKAFYQRPAPDGSRPGTYYANLYNMRAMPKYEMEALAYHEGIPGHHMQIAIAQELQNIPKFRKFGGYTSYIEGWGLYSEYLPKELGFYSDPYSDFGRLSMELWRSCRLVVDTGIHSKKWTREDGIRYYSENTPNDISDCIKMVERHIVMPSQATAYKIGMDKILQLRLKAKESLGDNFDIREFHDTILSNGALPLNFLELEIDEMIKRIQTGL